MKIAKKERTLAKEYNKALKDLERSMSTGIDNTEFDWEVRYPGHIINVLDKAGAHQEIDRLLKEEVPRKDIRVFRRRWIELNDGTEIDFPWEEYFFKNEKRKTLDGFSIGTVIEIDDTEHKTKYIKIGTDLWANESGTITTFESIMKGFPDYSLVSRGISERQSIATDAVDKIKSAAEATTSMVKTLPPAKIPSMKKSLAKEKK
jgi:hypothetical protein